LPPVLRNEPESESEEASPEEILWVLRSVPDAVLVEERKRK
jgi:hypothetical protein